MIVFETPEALAARVLLVGTRLDACIGAARAAGYRIVRDVFEAEMTPDDRPGVCALAAYNAFVSKVPEAFDGGQNLGFDHSNIEGEWDAFEAGWDGTTWQHALSQFTSFEGNRLSPAFWQLGLDMAVKHQPEAP